jgi:hypothetical protein
MKTLEQKIRARAAVCGDWRLESELLALAAEADALEARAAAAEEERLESVRCAVLEERHLQQQHAAALARRVEELEDAVLAIDDHEPRSDVLRSVALNGLALSIRIRAARAQSAAAGGEGDQG